MLTNELPSQVKVKSRSIFVVVLLLGLSGCRLASNAPNAKWLADFQQADSLVIEEGQVELTISDSQAINCLQQIYENAKWEKYWHTLPGDLGKRSICLVAGDAKIRRFNYTGVLWESESYTEHRTAELSESDRQFIDSLFSRIPNTSPPTELAR